MNLNDYVAKGWLKKHQTSKEEIKNLFAIVNRDINCAKEDIVPDWRFGIAYNAALKLCTILLFSSGYRVQGSAHHMKTIELLPVIMGNDRKDDSDYLDTCRRKRNIIEYESVGGATDKDVEELISFVDEFKKDVEHWVYANRADLI